ncbi:MAG: SRPBCC family protein [Bacteroidota bacterium]
MKKIIVRTLAALAAIVAVILIVASTKPDTFRIERTTSIKASSEKISTLISNFHKWNSWSPFEKLDPAMKRTFSGSNEGLGAVYEWEGNSNAGSGRMEVLNVSSSKITIKLDFFKPFEAHNTAEFTLEPDGEFTKVTWAMHGPNQFLGKVMTVFMSMDAMVGKQFETGLSNLKSVSEM